MPIYNYPDPYMEFTSRSITSKILLPKIQDPVVNFLTNPYCGYNSFIGCGTDTAYFQPICSPDYCGCMVFTGEQGNPLNSQNTIFECPTVRFNFPYELGTNDFSIKANYYYPLDTDFYGTNKGNQKFDLNGIITCMADHSGTPNVARGNYWSFGVTSRGALYFDIYVGVPSTPQYLRFETAPFTLANGQTYDLEFRRDGTTYKFIINGTEVPFSQVAGRLGIPSNFTIDNNPPTPTNTLFLGIRSFQTVNGLTPLGIGSTGNLTGDICNFSIEISGTKVQETHFDCYGLQAYPDLWRDVVFGNSPTNEPCYGYPENCDIITQYIPEGEDPANYAISFLTMSKRTRGEMIAIGGGDFGAHCGSVAGGSPCPGNSGSCTSGNYRNSTSDNNPWHFLTIILATGNCTNQGPPPHSFEYGVSPQYNCNNLTQLNQCDSPCIYPCLTPLAPGSFVEVNTYDAFDKFLQNWIAIHRCNFWEPSYGGTLFRDVDPDPDHARIIFVTDRRKLPGICNNLRNCYIRDFDGASVADPFESVYETFCCDYQVDYDTIDPIVSRKGSNGVVQFECGNPFRRRLCQDVCNEDQTSCKEADLIEFQLNLPDRLNNWDDSNFNYATWTDQLTGDRSFGAIEVYDFETGEKVDVAFDYFVYKHVVGAVKYQSEQTWTNIQIVKINPYFLPCKFYFKFSIQTNLNPQTTGYEQSIQFYTEPFEKISCANKTLMLTGLYPDGTKDCIGRYYGKLDKGAGNWDLENDVYDNSVRLYGEISPSSFSVETETKITTKVFRVIRSNTRENFKFRLRPIPPYMADNLKYALSAQEVLVDGTAYTFNGTVEKNNDNGLMWIPDITLQKLDICATNDFTCS